MVSFLCIYRGATLQSASLVAVSTDVTLVGYVAPALLRKPSDTLGRDPAAEAVESGRRRALRLIQREAPPAAGPARSRGHRRRRADDTSPA